MEPTNTAILSGDGFLLPGYRQLTYRRKTINKLRELTLAMPIMTLSLADGSSARDISTTSGFPKNTLSRAIKLLESSGLIEKGKKMSGSGRKQALHLSQTGWEIINKTKPAFEQQEKRMLETLTDGERQMLFELLSKVLIHADNWLGSLPGHT